MHIIWGGHGVPHNFESGLWNMISRPLKKFLDPVARFSKQLNGISNEENFLWRPHLDAINFYSPFSSPPMWVETYSVFLE